MFRSTIQMLLVVLVGISIQACATTSTSSQAWVSLKKPVHFQTTGGEPVVVPAGTYRVGYGGDIDLQLVSDQTGEVIKIQAASMVHSENADSLLAFSVQNQPDEHHVILWMPGGMGLDAAGTYSGVQSRAAGTPLNQQAIKSYAQIARSSYLGDRMSSFPPPATPMPDLIVSASPTPYPPKLNQAFSLRIYIINQGQADATLIRQATGDPHIWVQTFDSAGNPAGGTSFHIPTLPLTIPAGASRYVDLPSAPLLNRSVGTFYWQFSLHSFLSESNISNNVAPRMPVTVQSP